MSPAQGKSAPLARIEGLFLVIRGLKVMVDADLAELYGAATKALKRNARRFPRDFMFQLTQAEKLEVVTNCDHLATLKFAKSLPFAFTEHGAIKVANVLNSEQAVEMGGVVRAFVHLREMTATNKELALRLDELDNKTALMSLKSDTFEHNTRIQLKQIFDAIRELMAPAEPIKKHPIDFVTTDDTPAKPKAAKAKTKQRPGGEFFMTQTRLMEFSVIIGSLMKFPIGARHRGHGVRSK